MEIKHILKNGAVLADISGHVVKISENPKIYEVMNQINDQISSAAGGEHEQQKKTEKK